MGFMALNKNTGAAQCWGTPHAGGNCGGMDFSGVTEVYSTGGAFMALKKNNTEEDMALKKNSAEEDVALKKNSTEEDSVSSASALGSLSSLNLVILMLVQ